ncbi:MAG: 16S rRNA (guanine(966)-N(2))-methyltransferase RsmD, partial [Mycoplasmatales bacterium]
MRIIAGEYRGMILVGPKNNDIRPTMDRAKEGLFNVINQDIYMADFLDLFSGSGSIGAEAISRGAKSVVFVEQERHAIDLINQNTRRFEDVYQIVRNDVLSYTKNCTNTFDFIFLDPPYDMEM